MTEFFQHTFHKGRNCKSRHHVNPSGSEGGKYVGEYLATIDFVENHPGLKETLQAGR
jgi:hypothetical protein